MGHRTLRPCYGVVSDEGCPLGRQLQLRQMQQQHLQPARKRRQHKWSPVWHFRSSLQNFIYLFKTQAAKIVSTFAYIYLRHKQQFNNNSMARSTLSSLLEISLTSDYNYSCRQQNCPYWTFTSRLINTYVRFSCFQRKNHLNWFSLTGQQCICK